MTLFSRELLKKLKLSKAKQHTIRFTVVSIFILATIVTATVAISLQYHFSKSMATDSASHLFSLTSQNTRQQLHSIDKRAENVTRMFASFADLVDGNTINESALPLFSEMLTSNPNFYAIYIGFANGDFYELINLNASPAIRSQLSALPQDRWVIVSISGDKANRLRKFSYLNPILEVRAEKEERSNYDASSRLWYKDAKEGSVSKTEPYMFQHLQAPGQTYSAKIPNSSAVLAIDIALSSFESYLTEESLGTHGIADKQIYLFQKSGEIIASNQASSEADKEVNGINDKLEKIALSPSQLSLIKKTPTLKVSNETDWAPVDFSISGEPQGYSIDMLNMVSEMTGLNFMYTNGFTWQELLDSFDNGSIDLLQPLFKTQGNLSKGLFSDPIMELPFAIITQKGNTNLLSMSQLSGKRLGIPKGWSIIKTIEEYFPSITIVEYPSTRALLAAVSAGEVLAGLDNEAVFRYIQKQFFINNIQYHQDIDFSPAILDTSLHLVLKPSQTELMDVINLALSQITTEQKRALDQKWLNQTSLANKVKKQGVVPYSELITFANEASNFGKLLPLTIDEVNHFLYLTPVNQANSEFLAIIVPKATIFASSTSKVKISIMITTLCLLLILPISWIFSGPIVKPIKLLAIENEKIKHRKYDDVIRVVSNIKEIDALALSLVDMSSSIKEHERKQEELMDSFIQLIAQTIDDKSPYTGGHCNRVPELGIMLADAAAKSNDSPFNMFTFETPEQYREFKIAAWLHDCGKIITPEHIVDKGSKLEAIYNRIHEIRMRFEVLWRDAEINYYQLRITSPEREDLLLASLKKQQAQLKSDFDFIAKANVGGEFMSDDKIEHLNELSKITWQRHFDDTLGLSPVEETHLAGLSIDKKVTLPATEQLLSDKAEHIVTRENTPKFDAKLGIKMTIPEHQYNLGELHNLSISRGTLTAEDRYKINEHIIGTIKMLEQLPFPPELKNVPKYASTHHETLIGTGYPRKLSAKDLSIPERVLVIADIFEALTAADRPYKKAKPLSVAVDILHKFALDKHIDFDLFELFLTSGIYLTYANKFMKPEQINDVNIEQYLRQNNGENNSENTSLKKVG
jgi:HD-GYP domain-containing protein (c-di-GMP phosphodiesterase class II)/ABC-type amino acid transport substrate-binding protein